LPSTTSSQPTNARPRIFYVSYDGAAEPLGRSQVLPYLVRLARDFEITLISFEKEENERGQLRARLSESGIRWIPLRYHRRPPVFSTIVDLINGRRALIRAARDGAPAIVHVRSYVPALMALLARPVVGGKLLFDIRGFWADERVDGGLWPAGGLLYRIAKRCERRFFVDADAVVTLTRASIPQIREWTDERQVRIEVIPTCVDVERFAGRSDRPGGAHAVWSGSIGTWYRFDLAPRLAEALGLPLTVLTRQAALAHQLLAGRSAEVRSVAADAIPDELFAGDAGLCLIVSAFSKIASAPTRFAEYLAAGMPVIVTPGVGDLEAIVENRRIGVTLAADADEAVAGAAEKILALARDPGTRDRCRAAARELFDVDRGSDAYRDVYRELIDG
jgi:glycosyltransferase involved in cell wall biosynthesis